MAEIVEVIVEPIDETVTVTVGGEEVITIDVTPVDETVTVVVGDGEFSTVDNSDDSFSVDLPCGVDYELEDVTFIIKDSDGNTVDTEIYPSMKAGQFLIGSTGVCQSVFTFGLTVNGTSYGNVSLNVFEDLNITT